jgi:GPH family glycoside/pentoside/hexuronide:cation symporter
MLFNLVASLVTAVAAPQIIRSAPTARDGYVLVAAIFGLMAVIPFLALFFATAGRATAVYTKAPRLLDSLKAAWKNIPFRLITVIHLLNWIAVDLFAFMLPFYIVYWLEGGHQNPMLDVPLIGSVSVESAVLGLILGPAVLALPLWLHLSRRINKHVAYGVGISVWMVAQFIFMLVQPGQRSFALILAFIAGIGVSAAHVLPDAIFPDVMEWDELMTGQQRVGAFYGIRTFVRKVATAGALAVASQILGMSGYRSPSVGAISFQQMPNTLLTIRLLTSVGVTALLVGGVTTAAFYPLNRERHARVRRLLVRRREREAARHESTG